MKHSRVASLVVASAAVFVAGLALAQDRFSLKSPNGIAFSEFAGYETWLPVTTSMPDNASGCGSSPEPGCIKAIIGNPAMIKAYQDGFPANGKPVPDGAVLAKIEWRKAREAVPYPFTGPGDLAEVGFMMKDAKRFADTQGWGFATLKYDPASDTFKAFGDSAAFACACIGCHTLVKASDFVFTPYPKR